MVKNKWMHACIFPNKLYMLGITYKCLIHFLITCCKMKGQGLFSHKNIQFFWSIFNCFKKIISSLSYIWPLTLIRSNVHFLNLKMGLFGYTFKLFFCEVHTVFVTIIAVLEFWNPVFPLSLFTFILRFTFCFLYFHLLAF